MKLQPHSAMVTAVCKTESSSTLKKTAPQENLSKEAQETPQDTAREPEKLKC
jgi:hypothetical protein